jgi:hypothetical protein
MAARSLRFLFEGGAGLAIEAMAPEAAEKAREAYSKFLGGKGSKTLTVVVPGVSGPEEFIIDLRKVVALHVASEGA